MRTGAHSAPKWGPFHVRRDNPVSIYLVAIICGLLAIVLGGASCYMYAHGEAVNRFAIADLQPQAFAVYSADDNSLNFYKRSSVPAAGDTFEGKTVTAVYTDIETPTYSDSTLPWRDQASTITNVSVVDEGIAPKSTAYWFYNLVNCTSIDVVNLDTSKATTMAAMFYNCKSLAALDVTNFDTSKVTTMSAMFYNCSSLPSINVINFDTSKVTSMLRMFGSCKALINLDLSNFNTANVTNMQSMFIDCSALTALDLSNWNTSKVTATSTMFSGCKSLSVLDLSSFNTSKVSMMNSMFELCSSLTTIYVNENWSTKAVTNSSRMFTRCTKIKGGLGTGYNNSHLDASYAHIDGVEAGPGYLTPKIDVVYHDSEGNATETVPYVYGVSAKAAPAGCAGWATTAAATDVTYAAGDIVTYDAANIADIELYPVTKPELVAFAVYSADDNSLNFYKRFSVPAAGDTFEGKTATAVYTGIETASYSESTIPWNAYQYSITSATVIDEEIAPVSTAWWFGNLSNCSSIDVTKLDTSQVTSMSYMFYGLWALTSLDVSNFDTSQVTDMSWMFAFSAILPSLDVSHFDTAKVSNMSAMFENCASLSSLDVSGFDTSQVTDMSWMFASCSFDTVDVTNFDTSKVTDISGMFYYCSSLVSIDVSNFETSKVSTMQNMFYYCSSLTTLDLSSFDTTSLTEISGMFANCSSLTTIYAGDGWKLQAGIGNTEVFVGCNSLVGGAGTKFDEAASLSKDYAHIDGGWRNPGYFTAKSSAASATSLMVDVPVQVADEAEQQDSPGPPIKDVGSDQDAKTEEIAPDPSPAVESNTSGE